MILKYWSPHCFSHIGDKVSICSICGQEQGKVGLGVSDDIVEIEMEKRFKDSL